MPRLAGRPNYGSTRPSGRATPGRGSPPCQSPCARILALPLAVDVWGRLSRHSAIQRRISAVPWGVPSARAAPPRVDVLGDWGDWLLNQPSWQPLSSATTRSLARQPTGHASTELRSSSLLPGALALLFHWPAAAWFLLASSTSRPVCRQVWVCAGTALDECNTDRDEDILYRLHREHVVVLIANAFAVRRGSASTIMQLTLASTWMEIAPSPVKYLRSK
jgi:hypothetical protein